MKKSLEYYLGLPYSVEMRQAPDEGWFVHVREWPGCMSQADTAEEALANIQEVIPLWLEGALESDYEIPEPRGVDDYSGRFMVRVPRLLHRSLAELAEREAISLNLLVNVALADFIGQERPGKAGESLRDRAVVRSGFAGAAAWSVTPKEATRRLGVDKRREACVHCGADQQVCAVADAPDERVAFGELRNAQLWRDRADHRRQAAAFRAQSPRVVV